MAVFKCKMCGETLEFSPGDRIAVCDSCGSKQTLPQLDDNRLRALYERADALHNADLRAQSFALLSCGAGRHARREGRGRF